MLSAFVMLAIGSKQMKFRSAGGESPCPPRPLPDGLGAQTTTDRYLAPTVTSSRCFLPITVIVARPPESRTRSPKTSSRLYSLRRAADGVGNSCSIGSV